MHNGRGDAPTKGTVPTFLVVGAGRAGTTALVEGLRGHPQIFITDPKEPHYFALQGTRPAFRGPGDDRGINEVAVTEEEDYLALYPRGSHHLALGEGSVSTFYYHERSIPEVLRINPDMRVVVLLREPVERAYSSFQYLRAQGREPHVDLLAAVAEEPSRRERNWHHLWHYTGMSMYADALEAFLTRLPEEQVGVWFYDDLERDYAGVLEAVQSFLKVDAVPGAAAGVPRVNASGTPRLLGVQKAMWWASSRPALRRSARLVTTWRFREAVKGRLLKRQSVPAHVHRELAPRFQEDLLRVRELLRPRTALPPWLADNAH
jgi:Sulfotransferase family